MIPGKGTKIQQKIDPQKLSGFISARKVFTAISVRPQTVGARPDALRSN
jgi:hypothetical protein